MHARRPATPTDTDSRERLLRAGQAMALEGGLRRLTVRAVAARAGANLGSFVYHFGTRDAFVAELIERAYAPLMAGLQLSAHAEADPLQRLRLAVQRLLDFALAQRSLIAQLLLDAGAGEAGARAFLRGIETRHPALLLALITEAQRAGRLRAGEPLHLLLFLMSSTAVPVLLFFVIGRSDTAPPQLAQALARLAEDPVRIAERLDWALRALAPDPEDRP